MFTVPENFIPENAKYVFDNQQNVIEEKLQMLAAMGFHDRNRAIELLNKHNQDIHVVVQELLKDPQL